MTPESWKLFDAGDEGPLRTPEEWEHRERTLRTRSWRTARIERFTERQRQVRKWINFAEIAEWCADEDASIMADNAKRLAAFDTLASDLAVGDFEENGRSRVLYLHPFVTKARMTRAMLKDAIENNYGNNRGRSDFLARCWIPRAMFDQWLAKHRLQSSPPRFAPKPATLKRPKPGRPDFYNWGGVQKKLSAYAKQDGPVQNWNELLQKCADFAAELSPDQSTPDDSTIRAAIKNHRLDKAAGFTGSPRRRPPGK